jgi:multidrug efflux pump subunit AcrA (membrane-fusion protein)
MYTNKDKINNHDEDIFENIDGTTVSKLYPRFSYLLIILIVFGILCMFLPWIQTSPGNGTVTTLNPEDRLQQIVAPVGGRVVKWYVRDGSRVESGDKIVELADIDPLNIQRLNAEIASLNDRYIAAKDAASLSQLNYNRQNKLLAQGLTSRKDMEAANIAYRKNIGDQEYYKSLLIKSQAGLSRQQNQLIYADRSGYIVSTLASSQTKIVKPGDTLASFAPDATQFAAEIYVDGNDIPLIKIGQSVRLIFDGWPSVQFSGWPSVSIGTFPGVVKVIDYAVSANGGFRVIIIPDKNSLWPNRNYLRLGTQVHGYIQISQVKLGYELWRQLNGFPISIKDKGGKSDPYYGLETKRSTGGSYDKYEEADK